MTHKEILIKISVAKPKNPMWNLTILDRNRETTTKPKSKRKTKPRTETNSKMELNINKQKTESKTLKRRSKIERLLLFGFKKGII